MQLTTRHEGEFTLMGESSHGRRGFGRKLESITFVANHRPNAVRLPLFSATADVASSAILPDLGDVSLHGPPAFDLSVIVWASTTGIISAVPLKPPSRIVFVDPSLFPPHREGLRRVDGKEIQFGVVVF